jgi:hypothetical protein
MAVEMHFDVTLLRMYKTLTSKEKRRIVLKNNKNHYIQYSNAHTLVEMGIYHQLQVEIGQGSIQGFGMSSTM